MHLNMSFTEVRRLPVRYRSWFIQRLLTHFKERNTKLNSKNDDIGQENIKSLSDYEDMLDKKFK